MCVGDGASRERSALTAAALEESHVVSVEFACGQLGEEERTEVRPQVNAGHRGVVVPAGRLDPGPLQLEPVVEVVVERLTVGPTTGRLVHRRTWQ